ncbi:MAG: hypothetical protein ABSE49_32635 [Polyangiaceae bacterium]|jgi:hypothetical protein
MAYRDVSESLRAYRDRVAGDLEEARRAAREAAEQASKVAILEKELAETEGLLEKVGGNRRGLPLLDAVSIAAPCRASWDEMVGDDHVRFCGQCEKNVYNLSSLPREEAEALITAKEGKMCVRLFRRDDGTVLTSDCPVGVRKRRRRRAVLAVVGGSLMAAGAAVGLESTTTTMGEARPEPATMSNVVPMTGVLALPPPTTTAPTGDPPEGQWVAGGITAPPRSKPVAPKALPKPPKNVHTMGEIDLGE